LVDGGAAGSIRRRRGHVVSHPVGRTWKAHENRRRAADVWYAKAGGRAEHGVQIGTVYNARAISWKSQAAHTIH
jgi:hypothetical protein